MTDKFSNIALRKDGKINSKTLSENYFTSHGQKQLWDAFIISTVNLEFLPLSIRAKLYIDGISTINKCYCGNDVTVLDRKLSIYCSKECGYKSNTKRESTSKRMKDNATEYLEKRKETMIEKYGHAFNFQRESVKEKLSAPKMDVDKVEILKDYNWCYSKYITDKMSATDIGIELGVYYGTVIFYLEKHGFEIRQYVNRSKEEKKIQSWLATEYPTLEVIYNKRINNIEYDIYIPSKNIAIEVNGLFWHSDKPENYHFNKSNNLENVHVFHFTDLDIQSNFELIQSMIRVKLGDCTKIHGRKCEIKQISYKESVQFEIENHIQGTAMSKLRYGIYYKNELVSIMTFGKPRFDDNHEWEIIRMCTKKNTIVVGGASKILNTFIKEHKPKSLLSYSDIRFGTGKVYENLGLFYERNTKPSYVWVDKRAIMTISRYKCNKPQLRKWLETYDDNLSQSENMIKAGYRKYFDCGNKVYTKTYN